MLLPEIARASSCLPLLNGSKWRPLETDKRFIRRETAHTFFRNERRKLQSGHGWAVGSRPNACLQEAGQT